MNLNRANQIQFWRFLSFFMIFSYHARHWTWWNNNNNFVKMVLALSFFVLLSGAMSSYSLHQKDFGRAPKEILVYRVKKLTRTYPLYIMTNCFTLIYFVPFEMVQNHDLKGLATAFLGFMFSALMLQPWVMLTEIYNATSWYVATIFWCGILSIPVHIFAEKLMQKKHPVLKMSLLALAGFLYTAILALATGYIFNLDLLTVPVLYIPSVLVGIFVMGMALGNIVILLREKASNLQNKDSIFTILEIITAGAWIALALYRGSADTFFIVAAFLINIPHILIFMMGYGKLSSILQLKPFVHLGNISFETYLIHQIIISVFCNINGWDSYSRFGNLYAFCMCMFVTLLIADFLHSIVGRRTER